MAQRPKAKPKRKSRKGTSTDKDQSARFIEAARMLGVDETGKEFDAALKKIVPAKKRFQA
jgi:hypothetical protein